MREPSDSAVRAAAIDPSQSFLIQAPAGSGKTELLTDRILALLATVNRPEEIVAITFTRKAASEMHARVLGKLRDGKGPRPEAPHKQRGWALARQALARDEQLGWNLLDYPARLGIRTIDSFCAYLVRAMPWMSGLGGMPSITDNPGEHYEAAAQATLAMADENEAVAELIAHLDVDVNIARDLLAGMLASRDQWLPLLGRGADNEQLLESLARAVEEDLRRLGGAMPVGWASALAPCLRQAAETLAASGAEPDSPLLDWDGQPFDIDMDCLPQWQALAQALLTAKGTLRRTVNKNQGFEAGSQHKKDFLAWLASVPENEAWVGILHDIRSAPCGGYTEAQQRVLAVLLEVLWLAAAQLKLRFAEAAEVDFTEISQRAIEALGRVDDPSDLLLSLDSAIRHILVDEFQDTSQTQIRLLELLTAGWMDGDGHTLFLVGDPMQSIYRFRKADVGGFLNVRDHGLGEVRLTALELKENFRSQGNLVEWVNATCQPIFPRENHPGLGAIRYTRSVPFNEAVEGVTTQFHPVWVRKEEEGDEEHEGDFAATMKPAGTSDLAVNADRAGSGAEAQGGPTSSAPGAPAASGQTLPLTESDADTLVVRLARQALDEHPDSEHPVAILVRARSHLGEVVHCLTAAGVPCRAVELVTLQSRQVVIDLAQLARALSHPADRLAWLSVLRSPLCGLTLSSLHALCGADLLTPIPRLLTAWLSGNARQREGDNVDEVWLPSDKGPLPPDEARRLRLAAAVLLDDSNAAGSVPFAAWLERCWQRLGGPAVYYRNPSDAADAERLFRLIEDIAPYGQLDPVDLEQRLEKLFAAPESSERAVEVMTLHKSKGLEFETVIMTGLHRRPRADTPPLMYFEPHGDELLLGPIKHRVTAEPDPVTVYLAEREKKRAAYETDRLLYVGLTRARHQLHLVGEVVLAEDMKPKKPAGTSLLGRLWDQLIVPEVPDIGVASKTISLGNAATRAVAGAGADAQSVDGSQRGLLGRPTGRFLVRRRLDALPPEPEFGIQESPGSSTAGGAGSVAPRAAHGSPASPVAAARRPAGAAIWQWREASGDEAVIGTVAHAWLERIGKEGADAWTAARIDDCLPVFRRQLARAGLPDTSLDHATEALRDTLASTLASERGQWLLRVAQAHREWTLLDISGRVSVIDLAISQENDWLVVDYKTGKPHSGESADAYAARMRERYREQIERYCAHVTALDGRPARGALYFPRADIWVDYPVQGVG
ncbi:UvrD-helicase domain-containing protein [Allopusillimonas ginsengisoli]|uniref:UvrD-helicase domain-containing protein n=1 Tax=Allopusillimonas ginsengisoli TaxID=453575 RepID=UPI00101FC88E|nr:UvrD-helicase domain-containing protein [Allopusillimonas ginsengisoli]TEA79921.1 nuclease [Allopusillimonas ginsengisoli]